MLVSILLADTVLKHLETIFTNIVSMYYWMLYFFQVDFWNRPELEPAHLDNPGSITFWISYKVNVWQYYRVHYKKFYETLKRLCMMFDWVFKHLNAVFHINFKTKIHKM